MTSPHPCFVVTVPRLSLRYLSWTVVGPIVCLSLPSFHSRRETEGMSRTTWDGERRRGKGVERVRDEVIA